MFLSKSKCPRREIRRVGGLICLMCKYYACVGLVSRDRMSIAAVHVIPAPKRYTRPEPPSGTCRHFCGRLSSHFSFGLTARADGARHKRTTTASHHLPCTFFIKVLPLIYDPEFPRRETKDLRTYTIVHPVEGQSNFSASTLRAGLRIPARHGVRPT
jgi:hypothetical protein